MKKRIIILATTKRKDNGVCIAGIDSSGSWVRPVRINGNYIDKSELFTDNKVIIDYFHEVDFELDEHLPVHPNTEDYKISENKKPVLIRQIFNDKERLELLNIHSEHSVETIFGNGSRSLGLIECAEINEIQMGWHDNGKFYSTISFTDSTGEHYNLSTTDLRWAAFGKNLMREQGSKALHYKGDEIKELIPFNNLFFSLGLTREPCSKMKELIIGVVTIPDFANCKSFWELQTQLTA